MNAGNVTVKRTTNLLLAAYITNRNARVRRPEQTARDLHVGDDCQSKIGMDIPSENPWR
jgi:hypothetical protein